MANEQVRFDIKVDVENAIQQLKKIADTSETGGEAVKRLSNFLLKMSKETKVPLEQLRKTLEGISRASGGMFSGFAGGDAGIFGGAKGYLAAAQAGQRFQATQEGVVSSINKGNKAWDDADRASRGYGHGIDVVRTALGTLLAVGIFQFLSSLTSVFTQLLHNIRETELAVYNLINAEKRLSEQGIDVTPQGLQETIDAVRELVPVLSQIQAEELVSRIATNVAPALKLTNEQIRQMAEATALLYIRNKALGKSFDEVESQLTNAFLTGKVSVGINNLGVKINDQIVKDEALRLGLVKTEEQFNKLTGEMESQVKAAAMLSVVYRNATQDIGSIGEYMKTADASIEDTKTAWNDLLTVLGMAFGPLIIEGLKAVRQGIEGMMKAVEAATPALQKMVAFFVAGVEAMHNLSNQFYAGRGSILNLTQVARTFNETFAGVMDSFKGLADAVDTPTANVEAFGDAVSSIDASALEKIADIFRDTANAVQDLAAKLNQKLDDIDEEYRRKALDAEKDYLRKIEDINRDAERDMAKVKDKHREQDKRDEEKYQLALWELRQRFLMDLEDALHARDARQVIRLQKQYNLDKEILRRKHELDGKAREENQKDELEDIERRRQERLEDAQIEYQQKLADLNLAKQRELQDLNVWYAREFADLQLAQDRKLKELLAGWAKEQEITEANAAAVYAILQKYFGPGGMTDALYKYMMDSLVQVTSQAAAVATQIGMLGARDMSGEVPVPVDLGGGSTGGKSKSGGSVGRGRAEGGTLIATRPTTVTFGEAGPEVGHFIPLTRIGRNEGKVDTSGSLAGLGMNGQITVDLTLSPDLRASVVEEAMDGVGEVILRINGSKV